MRCSRRPRPSRKPPSKAWEQRFEALPKGTKLILDVYGTPEWETGSADEHAPPANPNDYANFVATLARRWGSLVTAFEIWNEEDSSAWWAGGPDPAAYTRLLQAVYPAVKAVDPQATVVLGGLTGNDYEFLEGVYADGGKGYFDAVGVHTDTACNVLSPYEYLRGLNERMVPDSFLAYREVRKVMVANGDEKPIWMTELSWRTTTAICPEGAWAGQKPEGVTEAQQATYLQQAYHCLAQDPYVKVALWFPIQDEGPVVSGLLRSDGSHKPSFAAMHDYVQKGDQLTEECGVFTGPKITLGAPADHLSYSGPLLIDVSATSPSGVFRIKLEYDGKTIRNYGDDTDPEQLTGRIEWQGAKHIPYGVAHDHDPGLRQGAQRLQRERARVPRQAAHEGPATQEAPPVRAQVLAQGRPLAATRGAGGLPSGARAGSFRPTFRGSWRSSPTATPTSVASSSRPSATAGASRPGCRRARSSSRTTTPAPPAGCSGACTSRSGTGWPSWSAASGGGSGTSAWTCGAGRPPTGSGRVSSSTTRGCGSCTCRSASPTGSACSARWPTWSTSRAPTTTRSSSGRSPGTTPRSAIRWPLPETELIVSERDRGAPKLSEVAGELPFSWHP